MNQKRVLQKNMKHFKKIVFAKKVNNVSKSTFLEALDKENSLTETKNGAKTYNKSGSALLDFFGQAGAMRNNKDEAVKLFAKAFGEDKLSAIRILFYLRDVRGGQGERDLFRNCLEWIGVHDENVFNKIIGYVAEYGRWDDLFFDNDKCFELIDEQLAVDNTSTNPSLLAKWLPTINASSSNTRIKAKFLANKLSLSEKEYRILVRNIRKKIKTVEEKMSAKKWSDIDYSTVPSQASRIYKNAFKKHDEERYSQFIEKAEKGEVKINASTLYPYQIYKSVQNDYSKTLEALWNQLPDYTQGKNALVVADVSGSMMGDPMAVSVSLALYFAERNKGKFANHFITFSQNPQLQKIQGDTLLQKMNNLERAQWDMNTDLMAVFDLVLNTAVKNNVSQDELPETLYIISDMEFDSACRSRVSFDVIKDKYAQVGYKMPNLVFWNVNASGSNLPVRHNEQGVALVSGFSPNIFKMVVENKTPEEVMFSVINSERYSKIVI